MAKTLIKLTLFLIIFTISCKTNHSKNAHDEQVKKQMDVYVTAFSHNNWKMLDSILTDDFIFISSHGSLINKSQMLSDMKSGILKTETARTSGLYCRVHGNTAVITGKAFLKGFWQNRDFTGEYRITATFINAANKWLLLSEHASKIK